MALRRIVLYPEPVLHTVGKPVTEFDASLKKLVEDMFETMYDAGGVGLAAPQVGISERVFVMDCSAREASSPKVALINPEIFAVEGEQLGEEGCLSFPGIFQKIKRNQRAIVRGQDIEGNDIEIDGVDLIARCILHETDHCDGIVFLDRMTPLKRELAKRKIKKMQKTGEWE
ncbi:MAG: peptide deformylase [Pyrinomonadaceae bacterium]